MDDNTLEQQRYDAAEHQKIQEWAYHNWQWRGSPIGSPEVDWFLAEEKNRERHSAVAGIVPVSLPCHEPS